MLKVVEPAKLAKSQAKLEGSLNTVDLPRVTLEIGAPTDITYNLHFYYDDNGRCVIHGQITCTVVLTCYRCLNACQECLSLDFKLAPINSLDDGESLPEIYEPVLMIDNTLDLIEVLEEEILLGLPLVPKHAPADVNCLKNNLFVEEMSVKSVNEVTRNPFKDLERLTKAID